MIYNRFVERDEIPLNVQIEVAIHEEIFGDDPKKWAGIDKALELRRKIGEVDISKPTFLDEMKDEILSDKLTSEDVRQIKEVEDKLSEDPKLKDEIVKVLLKAQEKLATELGSKNQINNLDHVRDVTAMVGRSGPLAEIGAVMHDFVKLSAGEPNDLVLLAEHEILSAMAAKKLGLVIQEKLGIEGRGFSKWLGFLATHGEDEYPLKKASAEENKVQHCVDGKLVRGMLFGSVYVRFPSLNSGELRMFEDEEDQDLVDCMRSISCADKLSGNKLAAFLKYMTVYKTEDILGFDNVADLMMDKVLESFVTNFDNAPEGELKQEFWNSDEFLKSIMLISLLREEMGHEAVDTVLGVDGLLDDTDKKVLDARDRLDATYVTCKSGMSRQNLQEKRVDILIAFGEMVEEVDLVDISNLSLRSKLEEIRDDIFREYAGHAKVNI